MRGDIVDQLYTAFAGYPLPRDLTVCDQCGPEWSARGIRSTPLRMLSLPQLEALHVMSLGDSDFRHFFPRLIELLIDEKSPVFAVNLSGLRDRVPSWPAPEGQAVEHLIDDLWRRLLDSYPADLGYFSDSPTLVDFTFWCEQPLQPYLDHWFLLRTTSAANHLGDLVDSMFTVREPVDPAIKDQLLEWLRQPVVGELLGAAKLDAAEELWRVCGR